MAVLASEAPSTDGMFGNAGSKLCKPELTPGSAGTSSQIPPTIFDRLIFVRYLDHVLYNRTSALAMRPQMREAVGWLVYECETYIILSWDRDADPPTLRGGDPKASGLVLLKSDILKLSRIDALLLQQPGPELNLKRSQATSRSEYAFRPSERKTQKRRRQPTCNP